MQINYNILWIKENNLMIWLESIENILVVMWWIGLFILIYPLLMLVFYIVMLLIKIIKRKKRNLVYDLISGTKKSDEEKTIKSRIKSFIFLTLFHSIIAYSLFLTSIGVSIRREYLTKTFKDWEIIKYEDKTYAVIGKTKIYDIDFITLFEVEEKEDTLVINKNNWLGVQPKYIIDRKYKTFKNIVVTYI